MKVARGLRCTIAALAMLGSVILVACGAAPHGTAAPPKNHRIALSPQVLAGQELFTHVCYYCHGLNGAGDNHGSGAPALWGSGSPLWSALSANLNSSPSTLARFIHAYMPLKTVNGVAPGSLSVTQANDVAAFIFYEHKHHP